MPHDSYMAHSGIRFRAEPFEVHIISNGGDIGPFFLGQFFFHFSDRRITADQSFFQLLILEVESTAVRISDKPYDAPGAVADVGDPG